MAGPLHSRSGQKVCRRERQLKHIIVCVIVLAFNQDKRLNIIINYVEFQSYLFSELRNAFTLRAFDPVVISSISREPQF